MTLASLRCGVCAGVPAAGDSLRSDNGARLVCAALLRVGSVSLRCGVCAGVPAAGDSLRSSTRSRLDEQQRRSRRSLT